MLLVRGSTVLSSGSRSDCFAVENIFKSSRVISGQVASCQIVSVMTASTNAWQWWQWRQSCMVRVHLGSADVAGYGYVARSGAATDAECNQRPTEKGGRPAPVTSRIIALVPQHRQCGTA